MNLGQLIDGERAIAMFSRAAPTELPTGTVRVHRNEDELPPRKLSPNESFRPEQVTELLQKHGDLTAKQIAGYLGGIGEHATTQLMSSLFMQGKVQRVGRVGRSFIYRIQTDPTAHRPMRLRAAPIRDKIIAAMGRDAVTRAELISRVKWINAGTIDQYLQKMSLDGKVERIYEPGSRTKYRVVK